MQQQQQQLGRAVEEGGPPTTAAECIIEAVPNCGTLLINCVCNEAHLVVCLLGPTAPFGRPAATLAPSQPSTHSMLPSARVAPSYWT